MRNSAFLDYLKQKNDIQRNLAQKIYEVERILLSTWVHYLVTRYSIVMTTKKCLMSHVTKAMNLISKI